MRALGFVAVISLGVVLAADGRPLTTGETHRVGRGREEPVRAFWANTISDELATVIPQPGTVALGDRFDLVDQVGYLGRAVVERVDDVRCGDVTYPRAQVRFVQGRLTRHPGAPIVALWPPLARPHAALVLDAGAERFAFPAVSGAMFQLIDLDGDRIPDVARQQIIKCRPHPSGSSSAASTSCSEVWRREGGDWRLLDRAELPPCL